MEKAWEKAIDVARGAQKTDETFVLTLDGALKCAPSRLPSAGLFEQFPFLQHLSLANTGLISLEGFPCLPHLRRLVLSDNRISGGLEHLVQAGLKSLQDLDLSNNRIGTFEDLVPLSQLRLGSLDLYECPVTRLPDYRARVFDVVKSLQFLDKADREGKERFDSEEADSEEEDEEDVDNFNSEERANGSGVLNQEEVDFEDDEEDDELDVEEEDEYQDGVTINGHGAATAAVGHVAANATTLNSSDEDDVEDEDDFQVVAEVQDLDGEDDEDSDEIADDDGVAEDDEDGEGTEQASGAPGELDVQEVDDNAEDEDGELGDEDDDDEGVDNDAQADGEDEEEDYGTEYLAQSIGKTEDEDGGSDFEPAGDAPEDEDIDEDGDDNHIAAGQKRSRDEVDSDSDDDDRNPKRR